MQNKSWLVALVWIVFSMGSGFVLKLITGIGIFWLLGVFLALLGLAIMLVIDWRTV